MPSAVVSNQSNVAVWGPVSHGEDDMLEHSSLQHLTLHSIPTSTIVKSMGGATYDHGTIIDN